MKYAQRPDHVSGPPWRVLVVDDNRDAGETLAQLLAASGFEVRYAPDGESALDEARLFAPELAILDIGLPFMDGYELARRMKAMNDGNNVALIALSGYVDGCGLAAGRESGFDRHMTKPVRVAELVEAINTLIAQNNN